MLKRPVCEFNISPPLNDEVKSEWLRGQEKLYFFFYLYKVLLLLFCGQYSKVSCQETLHYAHISYLCVCCDSYSYYF